MPGAGAVFIGKMFEVLPVTLLVFAVAYADAKKRRGVTNSLSRVVVLFGYSFLISGLVYATFYEAIATSFGMLPAPEMRGWFDIPAQFVLAAVVSVLVLQGIGQPKTLTGDNPVR